MTQVGLQRMGRILIGGKECFSGWRESTSKGIELRLFAQTITKEHAKKITGGGGIFSNVVDC